MAAESVTISMSQPFSGENDDYYVITVNNNLGITSQKRLYLLLDISGSMSGERISLVVHACKAIIQASNETIELAIFIFGSTCTQITELLPMTEENKIKFIKILDSINTNGTTNLIDGIDITLHVIISNSSNIHTHCIILTDGEPDNKNVSVYQTLLKKYLDDTNFNCIIDVFGFGNSLNIEIIKTIYTMGKGIFAFISDKNMLATVFNNYIANLFSVSITNAQISFEITNETTIDFGKINIGNIQSLQTKDYIVSVPKGNKIGFGNLKFTNLSTNTNETKIYDETFPIIEIETSKYLLNKFRSELINILSEVNLHNIPTHKIKLESLHKKYIDLLPMLDDNNYTKEIQYLLIDIISCDIMKGQIMKAMNNYTKWGDKYIISLIQAHINQSTINFKDDSLQSYSGIVAKSKLDKLNLDFNSIIYIPIGAYYSTVSTQQYASSYNDRSAGCFVGESLISIIDKNSNLKTIKLNQLKSGDRIECKNNDSYATVQYIMKASYTGDLVKNNNLIGTSTHPIIESSRKWIQMGKSKNSILIKHENKHQYLYTISAIDSSNKNVSSFILNGIECATFGHGYLDSENEDNILSSTFWGETILSIFDKLNKQGILQDNVLTLDENFKFIRNEKKWCIGIEINGIKYIV